MQPPKEIRRENEHFLTVLKKIQSGEIKEVTFFEPSDTSYIESLKKRGHILFDQKKTP